MVLVGIVLGSLALIAAFAIPFGIERLKKPRLCIAPCNSARGIGIRGRADSMYMILSVQIVNPMPPRFLRKLVTRNDARSCQAWVTLDTLPNNAPPGDGVVSTQKLWRAQWLPTFPFPRTNLVVASDETVGGTIDIGAGGTAEIAVAAKLRGQAICYLMPIMHKKFDVITSEEGRLEIGEYTLKGEVRCSGLSPVSKEFVLQNKGTGDEDFNLKEKV